MRSNVSRALIALAAVASAVALFVVLSGSGEESNPTTAIEQPRRQARDGTKTTVKTTPEVPTPATITLRGGKPVGGVEKLRFESGERVRFIVRSDVADEVHVHGYDRLKDVAAGGSVRFGFPAKLEGVFEIELHHLGVQIAQLRVEP